MAVTVLRIGGAGVDSLTGIYPIMVTTIMQTALAGAIQGNFLLRAANYAVTAGRTLYITGLTYRVAGSPTAGSYLEVRYADNAALTTNPVNLFYIPTHDATYQVTRVIPVAATVAATKYVGVWNPSGTNFTTNISVTIMGFEV